LNNFLISLSLFLDSRCVCPDEMIHDLSSYPFLHLLSLSLSNSLSLPSFEVLRLLPLMGSAMCARKFFREGDRKNFNPKQTELFQIKIQAKPPIHSSSFSVLLCPFILLFLLISSSLSFL
jgi:hypothetical protein